MNITELPIIGSFIKSLREERAAAKKRYEAPIAPARAYAKRVNGNTKIKRTSKERNPMPLKPLQNLAQKAWNAVVGHTTDYNALLGGTTVNSHGEDEIRVTFPTQPQEIYTGKPKNWEDSVNHQDVPEDVKSVLNELYKKAYPVAPKPRGYPIRF